MMYMDLIVTFFLEIISYKNHYQKIILKKLLSIKTIIKKSDVKNEM